MIKKQDESFGIMPMKKVNNEWMVFIIRHKAGHWGLPKGHKLSACEGDKEAAERELKEETGLCVKSYLPYEPLSESYEYTIDDKHIFKTVTYFAAEVEGELILCPNEILEGTWEPLDSAYQKVTFPESKNLIFKLIHLLEQR